MAELFPQFGVAIDGIFDVNKTFVYVTGLKNLGNRIARRITTPTGSCFYDLEYGTDIRELLNAGVTDAQVKTKIGEIEKQLQLDEMIDSATVTMRRDLVNGILNVTIVVQTADGPFSFVLAITQLTVDILNASKAE